MQTYSWRNVKMENIFLSILEKSVWTISQKIQLPIWTSEPFLLEMQPDMILNFKWMGNIMLIMLGINFRIRLLQHFLFLFMFVTYFVSKLQSFFNFSSLRVGVVQLFRWTNQINWHWGLKSITNIKWTLSCRTVMSTIVTMLYIWENFIPYLMMFVVVHAKQLYYQAIHNFSLSIYLRMENCW